MNVEKLNETELAELSAKIGKEIRDLCDRASKEADLILKPYNLESIIQIGFQKQGLKSKK